jgi:hypothetical protein
MVTDSPYGIELDSEWRDRAGLNGGDFGSKRTRASKARAAADSQYHAEPSHMKHRAAGHTETSISVPRGRDVSNNSLAVASVRRELLRAGALGHHPTRLGEIHVDATNFARKISSYPEIDIRSGNG